MQDNFHGDGYSQTCETAAAERDCDVCGGDHAAETHGEAETVLQPSLHNLEEYADLVLDEAESRDLQVNDLRAELDDDDPDVDEITSDALDRIREAGFPVVEADDTLLIYGRE